MVEDGESKRSVYADPSRSCDIVMKGGITSGVVYPRAVCELARTFRFRNVGGTSAGAIAAAATAAAEYGRAKEGFERLNRLPDWIGRKGNLPSLFQPQRRTQGLFRIVLAQVEHGKRWAVAVAIACNLPVVLLGAAPAVALYLRADPGIDSWVSLVWLLFALGLAFLGAAFALLAYLAAKLLRAVPENGYGLCSGWTEKFQEEEVGPIPLTPWLYRKLNELAFLPDRTPLVFGHLWAHPSGVQPPNDADEPYVELAMMSTNLTNRRAHRLPMESDGWFFCPAEFRRLFPEEVVKWMEDRSTATAVGATGERLLGLPKPEDMPVIVATRMSLSFPVLLSAVPLWRVDESRAREVPESGKPKFAEAPRPEPKPEACWFSDGGISSNFPIHFFDGLVPRRPTFAINLRPFRRDARGSDVQSENTWMVESEKEEIDDWWFPFSAPGRNPYKDKRLFEFLSGIGNTMQNRVDEGQMRVPGFRDRIAHVSMSEEEGGMNLAMDEEVIEDLTERGRCAAERLRVAYTRGPDEEGVTWASHRWTRLRSTLAVLEEMHARFLLGFESPCEPPDASTYADMAKRVEGEPPPDYRWCGNGQEKLALAQIAAVEAARDAKVQWKASVEADAPDPLPQGRIVPRE